MNQELIQFQRIKEKVITLVSTVQSLKVELNEIKSENSELQSKIEEQSEVLKSFQNQEKISKIVTGVSVDGEKTTELKLKINEYIKEIDKCILHLSE